MNQAAKPPVQYGYNASQTIESFDSELWDAMRLETQRQEEHIELIASENYASPRVLEAQGSVLTNKYAEGYPGKRYYGGCEFVDRAEVLAIERAKVLFGAAYANVQPHSGSSANIAREGGEVFQIAPCPSRALGFWGGKGRDTETPAVSCSSRDPAAGPGRGAASWGRGGS